MSIKGKQQPDQTEARIKKDNLDTSIEKIKKKQK
jgi:hypothetical protein